MKRLIHSQRFGMIAEICDRIAIEIVEAALKKGLTPMESAQFALKKRLDFEVELNGATDEVIMNTYTKIVCNK